MKTKPIITQTELICRSILSVEREIGELREKFGSEPSYKAYLDANVAELEEKLAALKTMYLFEVGTNY